MLPAGLWFDTKNVISLTEDRSWQEKTLRQEGARQVLEFLSDLGGSAEEKILQQVVADGQTLGTMLFAFATLHAIGGCCRIFPQSGSISLISMAARVLFPLPFLPYIAVMA